MMAERHEAEKQPYPAEKARQGEIVLRRRRQRLIFFGGLIGIVILVLLGSLLT